MANPDKARLVSRYEGSAAKQFFAVFLACTGGFSFGYSVGYSSPALPSMIKEKVIDDGSSGLFGSLLTLGALIGGPIGGSIIDRFGRKKTLMMTCLPYLCGWLTIAQNQSTIMLNIGRLLTGIGGGMVTVCVPVYVAEVSTKSHRGILGACTQLSITIGILAVYIAGPFFNWKSLAYLALISVFSTFAGCFIIPESPHWLLAQGKKLEAIEALKALRDPHLDVGEECRDIEETITVNEKVPYSEFLKPELFKPMVIILFIMMFQQMGGINAVMFYTVTIFNQTIPDYAHSATIAVGAVQVVGTFVASLLMDRAGRKPLLCISGVLMSVSLFVLGYYFGPKLMTTNGFLITMIPVICLMLYTIGFSLGWGPVPILLMPELVPGRVRGSASAIAIFLSWTCGFIVTMGFIPVSQLLGISVAFYIFAAICLLSVCFVYKYLPETKGKSLDDIQLLFLGKGSSQGMV